MEQEFEWDDAKAEVNSRKHGVTFDEAKTVFLDAYADIVPDSQHSDDEERFRVTGFSERERLLAVIFTERHETIRIISARELLGSERKAYEEEND